MPSRRAQIELSEDEVRAYLEERKVMQVATMGPRGFPHVVPLWFVPDGDELIAWTFAKSQKAKNLERDPRATVALEDGVQYDELRGVMLECDVELTHETDRVADVGMALADRYGGGSEEMKEAFRKQAEKRVGMRFKPSRVVSWDHRKLGGTY
ncbi:MAG TPA: PPOX class F420-dependent oxidoreductase [Thermoleophilaceae bacterium]|jgi:PPOX class probable F420-dependent enzyme|nr:PPOX class F420-dependent oxidoreductase [Thermoleophilaceae bacterium]